MSRTVCVLLCFGWMACANQAPEAGAAVVPDGAYRRPALCARAGEDVIRDIFCAANAPAIGSLLDLQRLLGLEFDEQALEQGYQPPPIGPIAQDAPQRSLVLLNSSTALGGRVVSTLNPRAIILSPEATLAFSRGVQKVEMLSRDRVSYELNLYLVTFEQACNARPEGCSPGDLYTPRIESDWTRIAIEDDEDLKNSASDCRQCHQRAREAPIMLMRELDGPWTHFFMQDQEPNSEVPEPDGVHIVRAYHDAKGDEPYGNLPWAAIRATSAFTLQLLVNNPQPLVFDSSAILNERWPWEPGRGFPDDPLPSPSWYAQYDAFKRGEQLAPPYFEPFVSDASKLARLTERYRAFRAGELAAEELPDMGDIYPDDLQVRAEMGLQTEPGATAAQTLIQACAPCHNDVLDQSISRSRFNVDLARMDRRALDAAIARISLPLEHAAHMPPRDFRQIDPDSLAPLMEYLTSDTRPDGDDAMLQRAAQLGMAIDTPMPSRSRGGLVP